MTSHSEDDAAAKQAKRQNVETILPLLPLQQALLLLSGQENASDPGFLQVRSTLRGPLDTERLQRAWGELVGRHPALRASTHGRAGGDPLAVVWRRIEVPFTFQDWRQKSDASRDHDLAAWLEADRVRGLDLMRAPVMRVAVIRTGDLCHELVWTCHHLFLDGWSSAIALADLMALYRALGDGVAPPPAPPPQALRAYYGWAKGRDDTATESFWHQYLAGFSGAALAHRSRGAGMADGFGEVTAAFNEATSQTLHAASSALRLTTNTLVQGAWSLVLSRLLEADDVVFGTTVAGRSAGIDGLDRLVGLFSNVVPIRVGVAPEDTARHWLQALRDKQFEMQPFEHAVLADVHAWSDVPGHRALFDTFVVVENFPAQGPEAPGTEGVTLTDFSSDLTSAFPLTLAVVPGTRWYVRCQYDRSRFELADVERWVNHLESALLALATAPDQPLGELLGGIDVTPVRSAVAGASTEESPTYVAPRDEIELRLAKLWEEALNVSPIGIHDDYFALGGTSIAAVRLFGRIEAELGSSLPLSTLLTGATIAHLADTFRGEAATDSAWRCLVPIQAAGSRPPIACIHANGGHVLFYRDLARRLGSDQPVFGLEPVGLDGKEPPHTSIPEMAAHYVDDLCAAQPEGPYRLLGYCIGGAVCLEMARLLESRGHEVDLMVMIDSGLPWATARILNPAAQAWSLFREAGLLPVFTTAVERLWTAARQPLALAFGGPAARRRVHPERVESASSQASGKYYAQPSVAPITLIRSSEYLRDETKSRHLKWRDYTPRLDVQVVEAGHETILFEPEVARVAEVIRELLAAADGDGRERRSAIA